MAEKLRVDFDLALDNPEGLHAKKTAANERIRALQEQLDAPNKLYQAYNEALRIWAERHQALEGSDDNPETVKWYAAQLVYIDTELPLETTRLKEQRRAIIADIHRCVAGIRDIYTELFAAVQELIFEQCHH